MAKTDKTRDWAGTGVNQDFIAVLFPRWVVIPALIVLFLFAFRENVGYLSMDDLDLIIRDSPTDRFILYCLLDGRYLLVLGLRAFQAIGVDVLHEFTVFAVIYAVVFAFFCQAAIAYVTRDAGLRSETVRAWTILSGALMLTHGFYGDLVAWKNAFPLILLMMAPAALCLHLLAQNPLTPKLCVQVFVLLLITDLIYQPGTTAILFLTFGWALITALSPTSRQGGNLRPYFIQIAIIAGLYATAGAGYIVVTRIVRAITGIQSERPFMLASPQNFLDHLSEHFRQMFAMLYPNSEVNGPYAGGPVTLIALALFVILGWLAWRRARQVGAWIGLAGLILLLANPQNLMLSFYWPSLRSSFYVALLIPVLLIAACTVAPTRQWRGRIATLAMLILALQSTLFMRLSAERMELQRRDFAFAQRVVDAILAEPTTRDVTEVRLPRDGPSTIYLGLLPSVRDTNRTSFASDWAQEGLLFYATGRHYTRAGDPECPALRPAAPEITVRRVGNTASVCF